MRLEDYIHVVLEDIEEYKHLGMDQQGEVCVKIAKEVRDDPMFSLSIYLNVLYFLSCKPKRKEKMRWNL